MRLQALLFLSCLFSTLLLAQEEKSTVDQAETSRFPEAEFVGSTIFRSAAYVQPVWKGLRLESDYFGGDENDIGYAAPSWQFRWRELRISPGFGVAFGGNKFRAMPALSLRWAYERNWFVTEGLFLQGLLHTRRDPDNTPEALEEGFVRPTITDGDHISVRWRRLTVGGTCERIQFREIEWKGGGRVALRLLPHLSAVLYVLGPGTEVRGGLMLHPDEEK
jgi:hypothetical protein